jgi:hypothetical protein
MEQRKTLFGRDALTTHDLATGLAGDLWMRRKSTKWTAGILKNLI